MYVLGPLKTLDLGYSDPEQWPQAPSGKNMVGMVGLVIQAGLFKRVDQGKMSKSACPREAVR